VAHEDGVQLGRLRRGLARLRHRVEAAAEHLRGAGGGLVKIAGQNHWSKSLVVSRRAELGLGTQRRGARGAAGVAEGGVAWRLQRREPKGLRTKLLVLVPRRAGQSSPPAGEIAGEGGGGVPGPPGGRCSQCPARLQGRRREATAINMNFLNLSILRLTSKRGRRGGRREAGRGADCSISFGWCRGTGSGGEAGEVRPCSMQRGYQWD
jgi:hypothetical protein